jgi:hypothetical protein
MKGFTLVLLGALIASPAFAQSKLPVPHISGNLPADIAADKAVLQKAAPALSPAAIGSDVLAALNKFVDTQDAVTEATSIQGLQDPVGASCWASFGGISAVLKAHPMPLTGSGAVDYEAARLLHIGLVQICANPNCGQMWTDLQNVVNAINPMTLSMSLTSICSKIPVAGTTAAQYAVPNYTPTPAVPAKQ